jgi:CHAT domain-containing protein
VHALDAWEWFRAATFRSATANARYPSALPAFSRLGITQALVYMALEDRLFIWRIRGASISLHTVSVPRRKLAGLARRLYSLCSDPDSPLAELRAAAQDLSGFLFAPVESELAANEPLWVDLDEALAAVPFPVLTAGNGEVLGAEWDILVFPGVEYLERAGEPRPVNANDSLLAVGISALPGSASLGLAPLPNAVLEARQTAERFRGAQARIDREAKLEDIQRDLPRASVFHFAGHAERGSDRAALLVAGVDGIARLDAESVAALDLRKCRLAVISACSAEAPDFFEESRPFGLATALLRAGVSSVLATRWNLDSVTGFRFTEAFYNRLLAGDTVAQASHAASATIREAQRTAHPYYWAAYQLFGRS